jgi:hypothetical protein
MATAAYLRAIVTADTAQAQAKLAAVGAEVKTLGAQGSSRLAAFGGAGKLAFGIAAVAAVKFAADSIGAYRESQQVLSQLQNVIDHTPALVGATTAAFQEQATALQNLTGYQDEEILSADTVLARFKMTASEIRNTIPLVLDYARATGKDVPEASELVGKALLGNAKALKEIGIKYVSTGNSATDLANIQELLRQKVQGAAEAFGETSQGKVEIFAAKLDDLQEVIGKALLPVVDTLVTGLTFVVDIFSSLPGPVQSAVVVFTALGVTFVTVGLGLNLIKAAMRGYKVEAAAATTATEALTVAEAEAALTGDALFGSMGLSVAGVGALGTALAGVTLALIPLAAAYVAWRLRGLDPTNIAMAQQQAALDGLSTTADGHVVAVGGITEAYGRYHAAQAQAILDELGLAGSITNTQRALLNAGDGVDTTAVKFTTFGQVLQNVLALSDDDFAKWEANVTASLNFVAGALDTLAGQAHVSANSIVKAFTKQLDAQRKYQQNFEILINRNIPADMAAQLLDMGQKGAAIVAALAHANDRQFARIVAKWEAAQGSAADTTGAINIMYAAAQQAAGDYDIVFHVKTLGHVPPIGVKATGGSVQLAGGGSWGVMGLTRPTYIGGGAVAGEGGRETVVPENPRGAMWIKDAVRQGVVEAGGFGSGQTPVVYVLIDGQDLRAKVSHGDALRGVRS